MTRAAARLYRYVTQQSKWVNEPDWQRIHRLRRYGKPTSPLFPDPRAQLAPDWTHVDEDSATWIRTEMNKHTYALNGEPVWSSDLYRYVTIHAKSCTPCHVRLHSVSVTQSWKPMEFCCDGQGMWR